MGQRDQSGQSAGDDAPGAPLSSVSADAHLAQALRELARGEQTATDLEAKLSNLESRLDEMLAAFEDVTPEADLAASKKQNGTKETDKKEPAK